MHDNAHLLSSCFHARVQLNSSLAEVKKVLDAFRCLDLRSYGTRLIYAVSGAGEKNTPVLELCKDSVSLRFFFMKPDRREYTDNLLRFLAILAYLRGLYSMDFYEIYDYVVEALHNNWSFSSLDGKPLDEITEQQIVSLSRSNAVLSHEFVKLLYEKRRLERRIGTYKNFCAEVIERASGTGVKNEMRKNAILSSMGVDSATINEVDALLAEKM